MNLWALIFIILFFVIRSVVKANEQIKKDNQKKIIKESPDNENNIPNKEISWEDIFFPQKEISSIPPTKKENKKKNIKPPHIPTKEKKIPNLQLSVDNDEIENEKWFGNSEDLRRAIINNEILSRKFNI